MLKRNWFWNQNRTLKKGSSEPNLKTTATVSGAHPSKRAVVASTPSSFFIFDRHSFCCAIESTRRTDTMKSLWRRSYPPRNHRATLLPRPRRCSLPLSPPAIPSSLMCLSWLRLRLRKPRQNDGQSTASSFHSPPAIRDIWFLYSSFERVGFTWVNRDGNKAAHTIASLASSGALSGNWSLHPPSALRAVLVVAGDFYGSSFGFCVF